MRLDKFLSDMGICSRRDASRIGARGEIRVNGNVIRDPSAKINEEKDEVIFCGEKIRYEKTQIIMMNKPAGYICAADDPREKTVTELLGDREKRSELFPVGRLDKDTVGLLIFTNDGDLCHKLLSPKKHVDKIYYLKSDKPLGESDIAAFMEGVYIEKDLKTQPADLRIDTDPLYGYLTIHEGKFHQVKRMLEAVGKRVVYLKRVEFGGVSLDESLAPGEYRRLTDEERKVLMSSPSVMK